MMLEYRKASCTHNSFKLAGSIFCNCGTPFGKRFRNFPCYHIFCEDCISKNESNPKCSVCDSLVERVEELHPNENILICTVPNCKQAFLNFPSLKIHAKISHSVTVDTVDDFYEKFGDLDVPVPNTSTVKFEKKRFKYVKDNRDAGASPPKLYTHQDSTGQRSPKTARKADDSDSKDDKLEILM